MWIARRFKRRPTVLKPILSAMICMTCISRARPCLTDAFNERQHERRNCTKRKHLARQACEIDVAIACASMSRCGGGRLASVCPLRFEQLSQLDRTVALLLMSTAMMGGAAVGVAQSALRFFHVGRPCANAPSPCVAIGASIDRDGRGRSSNGGGHLVRESWDFQWPVRRCTRHVYLPISVGGALIAIFALERVVSLSRATHNKNG